MLNVHISYHGEQDGSNKKLETSQGERQRRSTPSKSKIGVSKFLIKLYILYDHKVK